MNHGNNCANTMENSIIDWNLCIKLANNKKDVAKEILLFFLQQLPSDLRAITLAHENANHPDLQRAAHNLHGALCYCGIPRLKNAVWELECYLKQYGCDEKKIAELVNQVETEANNALTCRLPL